MPKLYKVNDDSGLFVDKQCASGKSSGYISYRMVICHAIFHDIKEIKLAKETIKANLNKLSTQLENFNTFENSDFFESYPIANTSHGNIVVIIDKTNGCYPLVLHNNKDLPKEFRIFAFQKSLKDINQHFDKIFEAMQGSTKFDTTLHDKLEQYFDFTK